MGAARRPRGSRARSASEIILTEVPLKSEPYIAIENAVAFQVPGNDEKNEHGALSPAVYLERKCGHQECGTGVRLLCFSKNQSADQTYRGRQCQARKSVINLLMHIAGGSQETSMKHGEQRQDARNESSRLGDLYQHVPIFERWI